MKFQLDRGTNSSDRIRSGIVHYSTTGSTFSFSRCWMLGQGLVAVVLGRSGAAGGLPTRASGAASASLAFAFPSRVPGFRFPFTTWLSNTLGGGGGGGPKSSMVEKVLQNPQWPESWPYSKEDFVRMDESDDAIFYDQPRLVYHIDEPAVNALTSYYASCFQEGQNVLDICSSWVSHFPKDWKGGDKVIGLGMNEAELRQNPVLTDFIVKDLNQDPTIPMADDTFDFVTCVVSVDYLTQPLSVFHEIGRVLKPGGECILSMSNRCFPTKAFSIWLQTSDLEHVFIAGSFFHYSGMFDPPESLDLSPNTGRSDPLYIVKAKKKQS